MDPHSLYARLSSLSDKQILLALLFLAVLIHSAWFLSTSVLTAGDWFFDYTDSGRMAALMSAWAFPGMGGPHLGAAYLPVYLLTMPFEWFWGFAAGERVLMCIVALGSAAFSYILVKHFTGSKAGGFFASLFYSYNTSFAALQTSGLLLCTSYALAPLILYLHLRALNEKRYLFALANVLLLSFTAFLDFRATYLLILALGALTLLHILCTRKWAWPVVLTVISAIAIFLVNFFWMFNLFFNNGLGDFVGIGLNNALVGANYQGMQYALNLAAPFWTGGPWSLAVPQPLPLWGWAIPLFLVAAFWFARREKDAYLRAMVLGLLGFGLAAVFLIKTTLPPFSDVYLFLFQHLPGFNAFRETGKLTILAAALFVLPLGYAAARLFAAPALASRPRLRLLVALIVVGAVLIQVRPLPTGEIGTVFVPRSIPPSYLAFKDKLDADSAFYRTVWIPDVDRYALRSIAHPAIPFYSLDTGYFSGIAANLVATDPNATGLGWPKSGLYALRSPYGRFMLSSSSIRYLVIPDDYAAAPELITPADRAYNDRALSQVPYLRRLYQDGGLIVYENPLANDHLYALRNVTYLPSSPSNDQLGKLNPATDAFTNDASNAAWLSSRLPTAANITTLQWAARGAAEYDVNATSNGPFLLAFSETYDSRWTAYLLPDDRPLQWWALPPASSELPHFKINNLTNAFWVEPCEGTCHVALFYQPQATLLQGSAVSIAAFLLIILLILFSWRRHLVFESLSKPIQSASTASTSKSKKRKTS